MFHKLLIIKAQTKVYATTNLIPEMKKLQYVFLIFFLVPCFTNLYAQDSLGAKFKLRDIFFVQPKLSSELSFLLKLDDRTTFIRTDAVDIRGIQLGFQKKKWKFWLGFASIDTPTKNRIIVEKNVTNNPNLPIKIDTIAVNLDLKFLTIASEYAIIWKRYYELSTALGVGIGVSDIDRKTLGGVPLASNRNIFIPFEPTLKLAIKPTRWVGLSGSIGYRETLSLSSTNLTYNGLFYSYGVSIYLENLLEDFLKVVRK